ncbi:MAG: hypothetical protein KAW12_12015 [Candidatus Aminicenantes bacterium]|nr:hypothetical protein [Candidatus Aminicenantes bacterium]
MTSQNNRSIKWLLSLFALLGLAMLAIPFLLTAPAFLYIQVEDAVFQSGFAGKNVEITNTESELSTSALIHEVGGTYLTRVGRIKSGQSKWQVKVKDYEPAEISIDIPPLERQTAAVKLKPKFGRIKVLALNVIKKDEVIAAPLKVNIGGQQISGQSGLILSPLAPGERTVKAAAEGYYPAAGKAVVTAARTTEVRLGFSPKLKNHEAARIVLQWDKYPRDLDSHLFLPRYPGLDRRHIYFPRKKASVSGRPAAILDVDDTSSYGPETVTITNVVNGLFRYAVFHYAGSGSIGGTSKAKITLYTHDKIQENEIREFTVPTGCSKKWWYVLDLKINGLDVKILPKNECRIQMGWKIGRKESERNN